jgi:hypothetical protein
MVVFNKSDRLIVRASIGMAFIMTNAVSSVILLFFTYAVKIQPNAILMGVFTAILLYFLQYLNIRYFKRHLDKPQTINKYNGIITKRAYIIIGSTLILLSVLSVGFAAKNYKNHRRNSNEYTFLFRENLKKVHIKRGSLISNYGTVFLFLA